MSILEKLGMKSPAPSEEDREFERRNTLRRGGPEADAIVAENRADAVEEGKKEDVERGLKFRMEWPQKKMQLERQIREYEEQLRRYVAGEQEQEAGRKMNDGRQFDLQSKAGNEELGKAVGELRYLRDLHAGNVERFQEEQRKVREQLTLLRSKVEDGDRQFEAFRQVA